MYPSHFYVTKKSAIVLLLALVQFGSVFCNAMGLMHGVQPFPSVDRSHLLNKAEQRRSLINLSDVQEMHAWTYPLFKLQ